MIGAVDIETNGLDARKFILGCVRFDDHQPLFFDKKEELWSYILRFAESEGKRGHNTYLYAHNHKFDFYGYADIFDSRITYISQEPFIANLSLPKGKLVFLDSLALSRCSLKKVGERLNLPKYETPKSLIAGTSSLIDFEDNLRIRKYCLRDVDIVLQFVKKERSRLQEDSLRLRSLFSVSQIGIRYLADFIHKSPNLQKAMMPDPKLRAFFPCAQKEFIHSGLKGAIVRAFQLGKHIGCSSIDVNSLYPSMLSKCPIPDLLTESQGKGFVPGKMGVGDFLLKKPTDIGSVSVRFKDNLVFPEQECHILGTWSFFEIERFKKLGIEIISEGPSAYYDIIPVSNAFEPFVLDIYERRKSSSFDKMYYKNILNYSIGKLAQRRRSKTSKFAPISDDSKMVGLGFKLSSFVGDIGYYEKEGDIFYNKFYCPIIPCYVNAMARMFLLENLCQFRKGNLLYCDTDSIIFKGSLPDGVYPVSDRLGDWKLEKSDIDVEIFGKKRYRIGDVVHISGCVADASDIRDDRVYTRRMISHIQDPLNAGSFKEFKIDLFDGMDSHSSLEDDISDNLIFIDQELPKDRIAPFLDDLKSISGDL